MIIIYGGGVSIFGDGIGDSTLTGELITIGDANGTIFDRGLIVWSICF